jgi:hypothetical protein
MKELWKDVEGYESYYQISNLGRVFSKRRNKILKLNLSSEYVTLSININKKCKFIPVHRLVAIAFIPNSENKPFVNHIDGDKHNNFAENLEWVTSQENIIHAFETELNVIPKGEDSKSAKLTWDKVRQIRQMKIENPKLTQLDISIKMNVHRSTIRKILSYETWKE